MGLKLVFIDIDGVVNNIDDGTSYFSYDPQSYGLSKTNIEALKHLIDSTGTKLVLSTSWRNHDEDYCYPYNGLLFKSPLKKFIEEMGRERFFIPIGAPHMKGFQKYYDILGFFYKNEMSINDVSYAVLDDQTNQLLEKFGDNFFLIDGKTGLTDTIAENVIVHLNREKRHDA
jgi:hypothetical protein